MLTIAFITSSTRHFQKIIVGIEGDDAHDAHQLGNRDSGQFHGIPPVVGDDILDRRIVAKNSG